jgi:hypothetical protein
VKPTCMESEGEFYSGIFCYHEWETFWLLYVDWSQN